MYIVMSEEGVMWQYVFVSQSHLPTCVRGSLVTSSTMSSGTGTLSSRPDSTMRFGGRDVMW
jgi:hypothetical protein